jgi:hypothetical protein
MGARDSRHSEGAPRARRLEPSARAPPGPLGQRPPAGEAVSELRIHDYLGRPTPPSPSATA